MDNICYSLDILGENYWSCLDTVGFFDYGNNISFGLYFSDSIISDNRPLHLMVYKYEYGEDYTDIEKCIGFCRLDMVSPKYITGYNETYKLTDDEIEFIYDKLSEVVDGVQRWDNIIRDYVDYYYTLYNLENPYKNLKLPNYLLLKKGNNDND